MKLFAPIHVQVHGAADSSQVLRFAAEELKAYLHKMFPYAGNDTTGCALQVDFHVTEDDSLTFDGYRLYVEAGVLHIVSKEERGILYGIYEFLKCLGCRFPFPLPELETVPQYIEFTWDETPIRKNPWLEFRGLALYHATPDTIDQTLSMIDWMTKNNFNLLLTSLHRTDGSGTDANAMLWDEVAPQLLPALRIRGTVIDMSEHSTDCFFPRDQYFAEHPEWFALRGGKRVPGQICYSNAQAVEVYADSFVDFVKKNRDFDMIGLWPLDGGGYCQCAACQDKHTIYRANTRIAQRIGQVRPDLLVEYLAYTPESWTPPQEDMPENMTVLVCDIHDKIGYEWGLRAKNGGGAFFFDYMTADNYRYRANVWLNPYYCHNMVNTFIRYHYRGAISLFLPIGNWWQSCINCGYLARLYYDPTLSVSAWQKDLARTLFGPESEALADAIFNKIFLELQDSGLWGRVPHALKGYHARVTDRCQAAEQAHRDYLKQVLEELEPMLAQLESTTAGAGQLQAECLSEYVRLQWLFFNGVDQYDREAPDTDAIEAYLSALKEYEALPMRGFISEKFARFRIYQTGDVLYDE